jgi:hypothetical protein
MALAGAVAVCLAALAVGASGAQAFVALPGTFTQVSAGEDEACAVRTSGAAVCWDESGNIFLAPAGTYQQVSLSSSTNPTPPPLFHACAVRSDQTLVCFGQPFADPTPAGTFLAVDVSFQKACAVRTDQSLVCWGDSLGSFPDLTPTPPGTFSAVAVSQFFPPQACALAVAQTITCWGRVPFLAPAPTGTFTALDVTFSGGCAVRTDQTVACWGPDVMGDTLAPAGAFISLSRSAGETCAVRADHAVVCWGDNVFGRGTPPPGTFNQVAVGAFFGCGVRTDQTLACWGSTSVAAPAAPAAAATPGAPAGTAPATQPTGATTQLRRLPTAFGKNGVFTLPSNRSCVSRRSFRIRIRRQRAGVTLVSAAVAVNGKRVAVRKGARLTAPVDLRGLPKGRFTVRISALTADGRAIVGTRRYRTCAPRRASGGHGPLVLAAVANVGRGGRAAATSVAAAGPVLGATFLESEGFGHARPRALAYAGTLTPAFTFKIRWSNWGAAQAVGIGKGVYPLPNKPLAEDPIKTKKLVAYDLGQCNGRLAYRKMRWWFPGLTRPVKALTGCEPGVTHTSPARTAAPGASGRSLAAGTAARTPRKTTSALTSGAEFFFVTPSRNVYCEHEASVARAGNSVVRCSIRSGLRPRPPRPASCPTDSTPTYDRLGLQSGGRGHVLPCAGDAGPLAAIGIPGVRVLGYGQTWVGPLGLSCISRRAGLTCTNRRRHGFFVSRQSYRTF